MNATTVAVDLAKNVFELVVADGEWRIIERHRLSRARFARFFIHRPPCQVVLLHAYGRMLRSTRGNKIVGDISGEGTSPSSSAEMGPHVVTLTTGFPTFEQHLARVENWRRVELVKPNVDAS